MNLLCEGKIEVAFEVLYQVLRTDQYTSVCRTGACEIIKYMFSVLLNTSVQGGTNATPGLLTHIRMSTFMTQIQK